MITLNDQFKIKWDSFQWHLMDHAWDEQKKDYVKTPRTTYHGNIAGVLGVVFERIVGTADGGVDELKAKITEAREIVAGFGIELKAPTIKLPVSSSNAEEHY